MEEENQSSVHLDLAKKIVDTITNKEQQHVTNEVALQVLKPILVDFTTPVQNRLLEIPERWSTRELTDKNELINDLASYL
jgi:hypothetical protein